MTVATLGSAAAVGLDDWFVDVNDPTCVPGPIGVIVDETGDGLGNPLSSAQALVFDAAGSLYVAGYASDNVLRWTEAGGVELVVDATGDGAGNVLDGARALAADDVGNVYVAGFLSDNVFQIAPDGTVSEIIDASGGGGGFLRRPMALATSPSGDVLVCGRDSDNVFRVGPAGIEMIIDRGGDGLGNSLFSPGAVAVDAAGRVYVAGRESDNVFRIDTAGSIELVLDASAGGSGFALNEPAALAFDGAGRLLVAGRLSDNVLALGPTGTVELVVSGAALGGPRYLDGPSALAVDANGIHVSGEWSGTLVRIELDGTVRELAARVAGGGAMLRIPRALAVDGAGTVNVAGTSYVVAVRPATPPPPGAGTPALPYCHISSAVEAATGGDTIHVASGTYVERVELTKDLRVVGEVGAQPTAIDDGDSFLGEAAVFVASGARATLEAVDVANGQPGIEVEAGGELTVRSSRIRDNAMSADGVFVAQPFGAGVRNFGTLTIDGSRIERNSVDDGVYSTNPVRGGGIFNDGVLTLTNSTVAGNRTNGYYSLSSGGGLYNLGSATVRNTLFEGNTCVAFLGTEVGSAVFGQGTTALTNCTVANNVTGGSSPYYYYYYGLTYGAAIEGFGTTTVRDSIVWGNLSWGRTTDQVKGPNTAVDHSIVEAGWSGAGANNLAQDPAFEDAASGDFSLLGGSPAIDAGDPASAPAGLALGGNPRLLDGDLDRTLRVDMGAFEFSHVELSASGSFTLGGSFTVQASGTGGLTVLLAFGLRAPEVLLDPWGAVHFSLSAPNRILAIGTIPVSRTFAIPPLLPDADEFVLQALGIAPRTAGGRPGNVSNPVVLRIR